MSGSRFLEALPTELTDRLQRDLETVELSRDMVLMRAGEPMEYVYFPAGCMISMVVALENGSVVEATTIGSDGIAGISAFLGMEHSDTTAMVQIAGRAIRMQVRHFRSF